MFLGRLHRRGGVSVVELLIVIAILGIIMGMVVPQFDPGVIDQLHSAGFVIAADVDYARGLAIANNSQYSVTFDWTNNRYFIHHTGANNALDPLPRSPFLVDDIDALVGPRQICDFDDILTMGPKATLLRARLQTSGTAVTTVEFHPLGNTTSTDTTVIVLSCGEGSAKRYLPITISPVTGLATVGDPASVAP